MKRRKIKNDPPIFPDYPSPAQLPKWTRFKKIGLQETGSVLWSNSRYDVSIITTTLRVAGQKFPVKRLGIANFDQSARHDWREIQRVKNELCGEEADAIEFYPAESRKVDPSNWFILWVFDKPTLDVGMNYRSVLDPCAGGAPQRSIK